MTSSPVIAVALMLLAAMPASAQGEDREPFVSDLVKKVVLDPTTYVPAVVAWEAMRLDWRSSQVFFRNGWSERNPRFTVSGLRNDTAIGYAAGNRQIAIDTLANLRLSLINNVSERVVERVLLPRYPNHRRLLRTLGWIERSAMASFWSYRLSAGHFRQWQENQQTAQRLGYN